MIVMEAESAADRDPDPGQESPPDPKETSADVDLRSLRVNAQSVLAFFLIFFQSFLRTLHCVFVPLEYGKRGRLLALC